MQIRLLTPELALLDAAVQGREAFARALGYEVAEGWEVFEQSVVRTRDGEIEDPDVGATWRWRLVPPVTP
jgi:hypothetical protein